MSAAPDTGTAASPAPDAGLLVGMTATDAMLATLLAETLAAASADYLGAVVEARALRHRTDQIRNPAIPATPHVRFRGELVDPDAAHEALADAEVTFAGTVQVVGEWAAQGRDGAASDAAAALFDAIEADALRLRRDFAIVTPEDREDRRHGIDPTAPRLAG